MSTVGVARPWWSSASSTNQSPNCNHESAAFVSKAAVIGIALGSDEEGVRSASSDATLLQGRDGARFYVNGESLFACF